MELAVEFAVTFSFVQRREVCQFLKKYPDVAIALGRLPSVVARVCPGVREIFLRVVAHESDLGDAELLAQIPLYGSVQEAQAQLEAISDLWWVCLPTDVRSRVDLDVKFLEKEASGASSTKLQIVEA